MADPRSPCYATAMPEMIPPRAWALLLGLAVLWGGSFLFTALALRDVGPVLIVWSRVAIAAVALWAVVAALGVRLPRGRAAIVTLAGMAVLNNLIPFTLIALAQRSMPAGLASILNATTPVWGVLLALVFFGERPGALRLAGMVCGVLGVVVLMGGPSAAEAFPVALILGATLSYALSGLWARRVARDGIAPLAAAAGQVTASALLLAPVAFWQGVPALPPMDTVLALLGLGLASTALAYAIFFRIIALAGGQNVMLVTLLIPPVAILLGILVLGEAVLARHGAGLVLILAGLALIDGRVFRR
ncbi:DMT family transporter [Plastoroseomonas arctica]|nr:DMT family transporter [Plastoroseomonas arctica]